MKCLSLLFRILFPSVFKQLIESVTIKILPLFYGHGYDYGYDYSHDYGYEYDYDYSHDYGYEYDYDDSHDYGYELILMTIVIEIVMVIM